LDFRLKRRSGGFGRQGDRFGILDFGFSIEEGDREVLGVRAIDINVITRLREPQDNYAAQSSEISPTRNTDYYSGFGKNHQPHAGSD
jgi:hypothetical protein